MRREPARLAIKSARHQTILRGPELAARPLWLRSEWSLDGPFSHDDAGEAGHADFSSFTYRHDSPLTR